MSARKWAKRKDVISKISRTAERQRRDDISLGAGGPANNPSGGSGSIQWHPLGEILTPETGITIHDGIALAFTARYGWDNDFLYLQGCINIGPAVDDSLHPVYFLGALSLQGLVSAPPAPAEPETTNWGAPCLVGGAGGILGTLTVEIVGISLGVPTGGAGMFVTLDPSSGVPPIPDPAGLTVGLDGIALPWFHA